MLRKTFSKVLVVAAVMFPVVSQAECGANSCVGTIERVFLNQGGVLALRLNDLDIRDTSCTLSSNYARLEPTNANFNRFYAMALTAYAGQTPITVRIIPSSASCEIQYLVMEASS